MLEEREGAGLPLQLERKPIKNMYLRVTRNGTVVVTAPVQTGEADIQAFIKNHMDWIEKHMRKAQEAKRGMLDSPDLRFETGEMIYVWGQETPLAVEVTGKGRLGAELRNGSLCLTVPAGSDVQFRKALASTWMKDALAIRALRRLAYWESVSGLKSTGITIRDMKTRWGSCNVKTHHISLSLGLAQHPEECLDYILVHELAHTRVPDHSAAFWELVGAYYPDWKRVRKELNG